MNNYQFSFCRSLFNIICWILFNLSWSFVTIMGLLFFFKFTGIKPPIQSSGWDLFEDITFSFNVGLYSLIPANFLYWFIKVREGKWRQLFFKSI